jgi:SAM-dependent methyltransferase
MAEKEYLELVRHYESCLERHGDSYLGVDWPKSEDVETRYRVMLDLIRRPPGSTVDLLDFGCGAAHLYGYMLSSGVEGVEYSGLDISPRFVALARQKYPGRVFYCADLLDDPAAIPPFDYVVMNGVFTERRGLDYEYMLGFFERLLAAVWARTARGLAFNVMSKHVDWERPDLFHLPFDALAQVLARSLTRNFVIRNDYGLYEYTTYVYR